MTTFQITAVTARNAGDAREWALCNYFGCDRCKHDAAAYDKASDLSVNGMDISIKASAFTLMSGNLCDGRDTFDGIWELFAERTHSNRFAYITNDFTVYMMNLGEFERFVRTFCRTERESEKNGGAMKIRCRKESAKMLAWLAAEAA